MLLKNTNKIFSHVKKHIILLVIKKKKSIIQFVKNLRTWRKPRNQACWNLAGEPLIYLESRELYKLNSI
jgi:hypothetical protein